MVKRYPTRSTSRLSVAESSQSTETAPVMPSGPSETAPLGNDTTLRWNTWRGKCNMQSSKLKQWASETGTVLEWRPCVVERRSTEYCAL